MLLDEPTLPNAAPVPLPPVPEALELRRQQAAESWGPGLKRTFGVDSQNLQGPHDYSYDFFQFWLEDQKGFCLEEARMLVSGLDCTYQRSLHSRVPIIVATEESYNHFMYWRINYYRLSYRNTFPTNREIIDSIISKAANMPSETTTANLRFCFLGRLPIEDLRTVLSSLPAHIDSIDFSYNLYSEHEDQITAPFDLRAIADVLIETKKHIILDNLPVTKTLHRLLLNEKMLTISASINRYRFELHQGNIPETTPLLFNFFHGSQQGIENVTDLVPIVLEYLRP